MKGKKEGRGEKSVFKEPVCCAKVFSRLVAATSTLILIGSLSLAKVIDWTNTMSTNSIKQYTE